MPHINHIRGFYVNNKWGGGSNNLHNRYCSGVRLLLYILKNTWPEISNALFKLSNFMYEANTMHYKALLFLIKYLFTNQV